MEIEKFNENNFELWKIKMEDILVDKEKWVVVGLGTKPISMSKEGWVKLDRKERSTT